MKTLRILNTKILQPRKKKEGKVARNRERKMASHLEDGEEGLEGDPLVGAVLVDELLDLGLGRVLAEGAHHVADEGDGDLAVAAVVVEQEGLLELRNLVLGERHAAARHRRRLMELWVRR